MKLKRIILALASVMLMSVAFAQSNTKKMDNELKTATFGAGCFWCTEAVFLNVNGVTKVVSGY